MSPAIKPFQKVSPNNGHLINEEKRFFNFKDEDVAEVIRIENGRKRTLESEEQSILFKKAKQTLVISPPEGQLTPDESPTVSQNDEEEEDKLMSTPLNLSKNENNDRNENLLLPPKKRSSSVSDLLPKCSCILGEVIRKPNLTLVEHAADTAKLSNLKVWI